MHRIEYFYNIYLSVYYLSNVPFPLPYLKAKYSNMAFQ